MIHPVFKLIATQPQLLADHVEAYAELVVDELGTAFARLKQGLVLQVVAIVCGGIGIVFAGVAAMLWAVLPRSDMQAPWALLAIPCVPLLACLVCLLAARAKPAQGAMSKVGEQVRADMAMFREAGTA